MSKAQPINLAASVKTRLLQLSRKQREDFNFLLTRYCNERLLYRITKSAQGKAFVLKGAMLFAVWTGRMHRPTQDLDLLGLGDNSGEVLLRAFHDICTMRVEPDGLVFKPDSVRVEEIGEDQEYKGQRVRLVAMLGKANVPLQVDIGFGDAVTPKAEMVEYPTLLDFPAPCLPAYPKETVVSEKLQAMVALGIPNGRMKDFHDVWTMSQEFGFDGRILGKAIRATFARRQTRIPDTAPLALTEEFANNPVEVKIWEGFIKKTRLVPGGLRLPRIITDLNDFLMPPLLAMAQGPVFKAMWPPKGPWSKEPLSS